jgi:fibronectin type 3 domain-containing protein
VFASRGNGLSFGWSVNHTDNTRDRNVLADQRLDTLCHFHAGAKWEIQVPNGTYNVFVSIGDPSFSSTYTLNVENVSYWSNLSLATNSFASKTMVVTVTDGRLTLDQGSAVEKATRIDYIEITGL